MPSRVHRFPVQPFNSRKFFMAEFRLLRIFVVGILYRSSERRPQPLVFLAFRNFTMSELEYPHSLLQADKYRKELEICCNDLSTCLEINSTLTM